MAVLKIITEGNPVLRQKSREITRPTKRLKILAKNMLDTLYDAPGVGLAAVQVGIPERLIVVDVGDGPIILMNPQIISREGESRDVEGCLSIPGRNEYITRAQNIVVTGIDMDGRKVKTEASGLLARVFQHEIDHLDGILFIDYLK